MVGNFAEITTTASILIILIIIIRALLLYKIPKRLFCILWSVVILRLLIPFYVPFETWNYLNIDKKIEKVVDTNFYLAQDVLLQADKREKNTMNNDGKVISEIMRKDNYNFFVIVWLSGGIIIFFVVLVKHKIFMRKCKRALPMHDSFIIQWKEKNTLKRNIVIKQSDELNTPVTFGVLRPVIILPKMFTGLSSKSKLFVITHEFAHIRRFDIIFKFFLCIVFGIYWFNPLIWVMYILANRDIELACDEMVIKLLGGKNRKEYAMTLLCFAGYEGMSSVLSNGFNINGIKERCVTIMKMKKISILGCLVGGCLCVCLPIVSFAKSAELSDSTMFDKERTEQYDRSLNDMEEQSTNEEVLSRIDENTGSMVYSLDKGNTWIEQSEYLSLFPESEVVQYWSAEEFESWLNESIACWEMLVNEGDMLETEKQENITFYTEMLNEIEQGVLISKSDAESSMVYKSDDVVAGTSDLNFETELEINTEDIQMGTGK